MRCSIWHLVANSELYLPTSVLRSFSDQNLVLTGSHYWQSRNRLKYGRRPFLLAVPMDLHLRKLGSSPHHFLSIKLTESLWSHVSLDCLSEDICHSDHFSFTCERFSFNHNSTFVYCSQPQASTSPTTYQQSTGRANWPGRWWRRWNICSFPVSTRSQFELFSASMTATTEHSKLVYHSFLSSLLSLSTRHVLLVSSTALTRSNSSSLSIALWSTTAMTSNAWQTASFERSLTGKWQSRHSL